MSAPVPNLTMVSPKASLVALVKELRAEGWDGTTQTLTEYLTSDEVYEAFQEFKTCNSTLADANLYRIYKKSHEAIAYREAAHIWPTKEQKKTWMVEDFAIAFIVHIVYCAHGCDMAWVVDIESIKSACDQAFYVLRFLVKENAHPRVHNSLIGKMYVERAERERMESQRMSMDEITLCEHSNEKTLYVPFEMRYQIETRRGYFDNLRNWIIKKRAQLIALNRSGSM
jgi:hypothetical protein